MSKREAIQQLNALSGGDPDGDHGQADKILLAYVPPDMAAAYDRLVDRAAWWATA